MAERLNPHYDAPELGLDRMALEDDNLSYEFDILAFWRHRETGSVFTATDTGCSCPTPFEEYTGASAADVLPQLERVGSLEQAERIIATWNKSYDDRPKVTQEEINATVNTLREWLNG